MPFFFGVGYIGQRLATAIARACGGDLWVQTSACKFAAKLTALLDPIGTFVGIVHEHAKLAASAGSETGRKIDEVLNTACCYDILPADLHLPGPDLPPTS